MAGRRGGVGGFLQGLNTGYHTTKGLSQDWADSRAAGIAPEIISEGGYGEDARSQMQSMDNLPGEWASHVGANQQRVYTNLNNPSQVRTYDMQPGRSRLGGHEFATGDKDAERHARQRHAADVRGSFDAEAGMRMHEGLDQASQRNELYARQREQWQREDNRRMLTSAVMQMTPQQLAAYAQDFDMGALGLPGYTIHPSKDGYQFVTEDGQAQLSLSTPEYQQVALAVELARAGDGEQAMAIQQAVYEGLDRKGKSSFDKMMQLAQFNNSVQEAQHSRDDSDRRYGLDAAMFGHRQRMDAAKLDISRYQAMAGSGGPSERAPIAPSWANYQDTLKYHREEIQLSPETAKLPRHQQEMLARHRTEETMTQLHTADDRVRATRAIQAVAGTISSPADARAFFEDAIEAGITPDDVLGMVPSRYQQVLRDAYMKPEPEPEPKKRAPTKSEKARQEGHIRAHGITPNNVLGMEPSKFQQALIEAR